MGNVAVSLPQMMATFLTNQSRMAFLLRADDRHRRTPTKAISGHVYDANAQPVAGATVMLFRQEDEVMVATTTSAADGAYLFPRDASDIRSYYTVAYSTVGGVTQIHGASNRGLVPV